MDRLKMPFIFFITLSTAFAVFWFARTSRAVTETPDYQVVRKDGKFEIRDYPSLTVATTPMEGNEMNRSFGQLFRFITGNNQGTEKIAMTTPVLIDTAKDNNTMSFIMPKKALERGVPRPAGDSVALGKVEAGRFAVLRFDGGKTSKNEKVATERLKAWLDMQKMTGNADPIFAFYDPPWTPTFLRRNEVMVRIVSPGTSKCTTSERIKVHHFGRGIFLTRFGCQLQGNSEIQPCSLLPAGG